MSSHNFGPNKNMGLSGEKKVYQPFGNLIFQLTGNESSEKIFQSLWRLSTHFAVVNSNVSPFTGSSEGNKKRKKFKKAFDSFPILKKLMSEVWWATEWAGTYSGKPNRLLVFGKTSLQEYDSFFRFPNDIFWHEPDAWDDLMLFVNDKLLFYCCTHEKFGLIIGDEKLFANIGLHPTYPCADKQWMIQGYSIPISLVKASLDCDL